MTCGEPGRPPPGSSNQRGPWLTLRFLGHAFSFSLFQVGIHLQGYFCSKPWRWDWIYTFWSQLGSHGWGRERLSRVRWLFFWIGWLRGQGAREHAPIASVLSELVLSFCLCNVFFSYSSFFSPLCYRLWDRHQAKEIKASVRACCSLVWKFGGYASLSFVFVCPNFFLSFIFNLAAKNSRVKADKSVWRLSYLPKCGRKHESKMNCFSQNGLFWLDLAWEQS